MLDILRQRLSEEEQDDYDRYDGRAALACHFMMWPLIAAIAFYYSRMTNTALIFLVIAAVALPVMLFNARRARGLRQLAEERYRAIMLGHDQAEREGDAS